MNFKKITISFFLLFVYSISFAHSLTFHEHGFYSQHQYEFAVTNDSEHNHEHHSHRVAESVDNSHIHHNNHCDEDVFDLITCVLFDLSNHQHDDCHIEHQPNDETNRLSNKDSNKLYTSAGLIQLVDLFKETNSSSIHIIIDLPISIISDTPLRGPPFYC